MIEIKQYISGLQKLLPVSTSLSTSEAERRSGAFLEGMAMVTNWRHEFSKEKIRLVSRQTAVFAEEMSKGTGKTMTQDKINAEASDVYTEAREALEGLDADISYLKAYYDIFHDGHIFYRQMSKDNS